jgi:toxic protein SymE
MRDYSNRRDFGNTSNKQPLPYERKLKVRASYYDHQFHNNHPLYLAQEAIEVPWINIKGYWLHEAGFNINTPLVLKISKGKIVLTVGS